jgi:hypothetical protein
MLAQKFDSRRVRMAHADGRTMWVQLHGVLLDEALIESLWVFVRVLDPGAVAPAGGV